MYKLKIAQIREQKLCCASTDFVKIVQNFGVPLSKEEVQILCRTFRRDRDEGIIRFDNFLRVVYAAKTSNINSINGG